MEGIEKFLAYLELRQQGLRPQALAVLDQFLTDTDPWPATKRREFVMLLREVQVAFPQASHLNPQPLRTRLVTPTLNDWQKEAPHDPMPWRLKGDFQSLKQAVTLAPNDLESLARLAALLLTDLRAAFHELPCGIVGSASKLLAETEEYERLSAATSDPEIRALLAELNRCKIILREFLGQKQPTGRWTT